MTKGSMAISTYSSISSGAQWSAHQNCVHELVEWRAQQNPDAIAVCQGEASITYSELNFRANQLARFLHELGVGPDERVVICMERGLQLMIAMLATMKAGGAYVPLDPAYPGERLAYMVEDCAPVVIL